MPGIENCLVIAAMAVLCVIFQYLGIKPDVIIAIWIRLIMLRCKLSTQGIKIIKYPAKKDFTDTELALDYALDFETGGYILSGVLWAVELITPWPMCSCFVRDRKRESGLI